MNNKSRYLLIFLGVLSIVFFVTIPFIGLTDISFFSIFQNGVTEKIFWQIRVPRVAGAFIAGSVLAVAGMMFQSMFRNDLATPYTLGVSSGAALGSVIAIKYFSNRIPFNFSVVEIFSSIGALSTVAIIFFLASAKKRATTQFLILAGVAVNFTTSGLILFIQYIASGSESASMIRWMMGSLDFVGTEPVIKIIPAFLIIVTVAFFLHRELDLMKINTEIAATRGVNVKRTNNTIFFTVSFAVAIIVSQTGPIGFIGLIAPHIGRNLIGREHRYLIPASLLIGGLLLLISDTIARTVIAPSEIPVGVITALAGGPFFLFVLIRKKS